MGLGWLAANREVSAVRVQTIARQNVDSAFTESNSSWCQLRIFLRKSPGDKSFQRCSKISQLQKQTLMATA
jgi:hypothetical protein